MNNTHITKLESFSFFLTLILVQSFGQMIPRAIQTAGTAAWMAAALTGLVSVLLLCLLLRFLRGFGGRPLLEIGDMVLGRRLGMVFQGVILLYCGFYVVTKLHVCVKLLHVFSFRNASTLLVAGLVLLGATITALFPFKGLARMMGIALPFILLCAGLILALSYGQYHIGYLFPLFGHGGAAIGRTAYWSAPQFLIIWPMLLFADEYDEPAILSHTGRAAAMTGAVLTVLITLLSSMAFTYTAAPGSYSALLDLSRNVYIGKLIQRLEPVFVMLTCVGVMLELAFGLLAIKRVLGRMTGLPEKRWNALVGPVAILVLCVCFLENNFSLYDDRFTMLFRKAALPLTVGLFLFLYLAAKIRRMPRTGRRAAAATLAAALLCVSLSGCGRDYREVDDVIYPLVLGLDRGETHKYHVTLKLMSDEPSTGPTMEEEGSQDNARPADNLIEMDTNTGTEVIDALHTVIAKEVSMTHIKMIVVSEALAATYMREITADFLNSEQIKNSAVYVVCKGKARDLIAAGDSKAFGSFEQTTELAINARNVNNNYFLTTIADFWNLLTSHYGDTVTAYAGPAAQSPVKSAEQTAFFGAAVFSEGRLSGTLNHRETKLLYMLMGRLKDGALIFPDLYRENSYITLTLDSNGPVKVKCDIDKAGKARFQLSVYLRGAVFDAQNPDVNYNGQKEAEKLCAEVTKMLTGEMQTLLRKLQLECDSDCLLLGKYVARKFLTIRAFEAYDWPSGYKDADISVTLKLSL